MITSNDILSNPVNFTLPDVKQEVALLSS